ncbi:hypothetical protein B0I26_10199 [Anoxybacillus vitaminiphilus]|uniref:Uncharacterized protein n=1 Tax=Paranoxybacillus vitaminiphilus TaxID=581036 RepID=A0A327YTS6_9BACL|nr:hypothetical protein [Anoxybacillus vitaminiphilus]RAK23145.1 hypothetical protein B0I26_10199 [Anoxybacillus vitaminiphilus]
MKQILLVFMIWVLPPLTTHTTPLLKKSEPLVWTEERLANNNDRDNSEPFKPREYIRKKLYQQEPQEK